VPRADALVVFCSERPTSEEKRESSATKLTPGVIGTPKALPAEALQRREKQRGELAERVLRLVPKWAEKVCARTRTTAHAHAHISVYV
jgi:hypothetical protein